MSKCKYKAVIFDLDGTLLDTLDDLMNSVNYALVNNNLSPRKKEEIREFVGNGIKKLILRAGNFTQEDALFNRVFDDFKAYYDKHCNDSTHLYEGVNDTLLKLREEKVKTAIVSNKADFAVQSLKKIYFDNLVDVARGECEGVRRKPAPDMVMAVIKELNVNPSECVYVGDSDVDIITAKNSNIDIISVTWGFRDKKFLVAHGGSSFADNTDELISLLFNNN